MGPAVALKTHCHRWVLLDNIIPSIGLKAPEDTSPDTLMHTILRPLGSTIIKKRPPKMFLSGVRPIPICSYPCV